MKTQIYSIALVLLICSSSQVTAPTTTTPTPAPTTAPVLPTCVNVNCSCVDQSAAATAPDACANELEKLCFKGAECKPQSTNNNQCGFTTATWLTNCKSAADSLSSILTAQKISLGKPYESKVAQPKNDKADAAKDKKNLASHP
jgi:hypothetical protein